MIMISLPFPIHIHSAYVKRDVFQFQKIFQVIGRYDPMSRKKQEKKMSRSYQQLAVKSVDDNWKIYHVLTLFLVESFIKVV